MHPCVMKIVFLFLWNWFWKSNQTHQECTLRSQYVSTMEELFFKKVTNKNFQLWYVEGQFY